MSEAWAGDRCSSSFTKYSLASRLRPSIRGLHSFSFQLNLSSSVHRIQPT